MFPINYGIEDNQLVSLLHFSRIKKYDPSEKCDSKIFVKKSALIKNNVIDRDTNQSATDE